MVLLTPHHSIRNEDLTVTPFDLLILEFHIPYSGCTKKKCSNKLIVSVIRSANVLVRCSNITFDFVPTTENWLTVSFNTPVSFAILAKYKQLMSAGGYLATRNTCIRNCNIGWWPN